MIANREEPPRQAAFESAVVPLPHSPSFGEGYEILPYRGGLNKIKVKPEEIGGISSFQWEDFGTAHA